MAIQPAEISFWVAILAVAYPYVGYPLILLLLNVRRIRPTFGGVDGEQLPSVSVIIPVHNEERVIEAKIKNTLELAYPRDRFEVVVVSDGSTDETNAIVARYQSDLLRFVRLPERGGKGKALDAGVFRSSHEILVFSDASIMLDPSALERLVGPLRDAEIGAVSGEDHIPGGGGESLYGRYELFLRQQESLVHSIVGASGSFYAQRRGLCRGFVAGMAPDFLSVLETVEQGSRAVTEPAATGTMSSLPDLRDEFSRKVRTVVRGITTLFHKKGLLNPFRYGAFAFELWSHKVMRWLVPAFLPVILISNVILLGRPAYAAVFTVQVACYALAWLTFANTPPFSRYAVGRICLYFVTVNAAIAVAWWKFGVGSTLEIWQPTRRER